MLRQPTRSRRETQLPSHRRAPTLPHLELHRRETCRLEQWQGVGGGGGPHCVQLGQPERGRTSLRGLSETLLVNLLHLLQQLTHIECVLGARRRLQELVDQLEKQNNNKPNRSLLIWDSYAR